MRGRRLRLCTLERRVYDEGFVGDGFHLDGLFEETSEKEAAKL